MAKKQEPKQSEAAKALQGGPVQPGMPYIVGERRPELFVPTGTADLAGKTIDERMADLLREHQEMGGRPK